MPATVRHGRAGNLYRVVLQCDGAVGARRASTGTCAGCKCRTRFRRPWLLFVVDASARSWHGNAHVPSLLLDAVRRVVI